MLTVLRRVLKSRALAAARDADCRCAAACIARAIKKEKKELACAGRLRARLQGAFGGWADWLVPWYCDAKVANREIRVWHFVIENGY